jgi:hypothetical protein
MTMSITRPDEAAQARNQDSATDLPLDEFAVDLDAPDVHVSAWPVTAAGHEVREPDLVDLAQVRTLDPSAHGRDALLAPVKRAAG